ncbi:sensor histidine kinase [Motiliproteus sp. SC1-56]|uniref:sensor histidine kinase n=1 Tax=Motiliproteus sp. SC1-56 TaxID=2799565 RepID=UPI001A8C2B19|nr:sensor histidine kinase [Motiliproteus sp. SC1-56]
MQQFALMGSVVLLLGMLVIGFWVSKQIENGVLRNSAAATALFMRSFIEPEVQELGVQANLEPDSEQALTKLLSGTEFSRRVVSVKIWKEGGLVTFSSRKSVAGERFPETDNLKAAWRGEVAAEFDALKDQEDARERDAGIPLLEIYSPLRQNGTGRIIAVAEFYERADQLKAQLNRSILTSWLVVGSVTLLMLAALSGIVVRGSRTIKRQRLALEDQVRHLSELLAQNKDLHWRLQRASRRTVEINERYLRRISADLHDGPAQLLAFALLRLDSLKKRVGKDGDPKAQEELDLVQSSLSDALGEVRSLCNGLTLPELQALSAEALVRDVTAAHERRTGTGVEVVVEGTAPTLSQPIKIGLYRFVQETLNNAYHHAKGQGQRVRLNCRENRLEVEVSDRGQGFSAEARPNADCGLGLPGLRERIESLGGGVHIDSRPGEGTRVTMYCSLDNTSEA